MLISMSELSCSLNILPPEVPFVGTPGGVKSNPWTRVLLLKLAEKGPTAIVLPRGYRLKRSVEKLHLYFHHIIVNFSQSMAFKYFTKHL
jgi:hypothetical protein